MTYIVSWTRGALRQLLDLMMSSTDPDAVEAASQRIEQALATDAGVKGESRDEEYRVLFDPPLGVAFVVDDDVGVVMIAAVGWSGDPI
ncbi:MAG: hypothetical protein K2P78_11135 [Gemmataceae bacterium]|nr:hypothetical protein [Gemmataceae bacterium]